MIITSVNPSKIPDCTIWLDFSDTTTLQLASDLDLATCSLATDKINGNTFSVPNSFTQPVYKKSAINNKGALYFGSDLTHVVNGGYSDLLYRENLKENNGLDSIFSTERTIFMVYENLDTTYLAGTLSTVTLTSYPQGYTNLTPGTYGVILDIPIAGPDYIDNNEVTYDWTGSVFSYIKILKYKGENNVSYCNYLNTQGLTYSPTFLPVNDTSQRFTLIDQLNTPSLFYLSSKNYSDEVVYNVYEPRTSTVGSHQNSTVQENRGTFTNDSVEPRILLNDIFIGNSGFYGTVPTSAKKIGFCGYIGEFIYYKRELTDAEINSVIGYLTRKWGL